MDFTSNIIQLFVRFLDEDINLVAAINDHFVIRDHEWFFTLPALHQFTQSIDAEFNALTYQEFRTLLFASPINHQLSTYNAEIAIAENRGKVDKSTYLLRTCLKT